MTEFCAVESSDVFKRKTLRSSGEQPEQGPAHKVLTRRSSPDCSPGDRRSKQSNRRSVQFTTPGGWPFYSGSSTGSRAACGAAFRRFPTGQCLEWISSSGRGLSDRHELSHRTKAAGWSGSPVQKFGGPYLAHTRNSGTSFPDFPETSASPHADRREQHSRERRMTARIPPSSMRLDHKRRHRQTIGRPR